MTGHLTARKNIINTIMIVIIASISLLLVTASTPATYADHSVQDFDGLTVVFIGLDTKGDSTLIMLPNGKTILIDGGMPRAYPSIKDTLQYFGVTTIDTMIITHPDQDHVAGINTLIEDGVFGINEVLIGPTSKDTKTYQRFLTLATGETKTYASDTITMDPSVMITVLSPPESLIKSAKNASLENSNSVITLLQYGDIKFLFTADATHATEGWLVENYPADTLDIDIMNAPHHGSKHASTPNFISTTSPEVVVFSTDHDNQYGHPHAEAVSRYQSFGVKQVYTTHDHNITIQTDGTRCSVIVGDKESPCLEDGITASSAPSPPIVNTDVADGTRTMQRSVEIAMTNQQESAHVKHVISSSRTPVMIDLVDSNIKDLQVISPDEDGDAPSWTTTDNNSAIILQPSRDGAIIQYILEDIVQFKDGLWTIDVTYPGVTTSFILPKEVDLAFVNDNMVYMGDNAGFNCHGCFVTLKYPHGAPASIKHVSWEDNKFDVEVRSIPEVGNFGFDQPSKMITFATSQVNQSVSVIIPQNLLGSPYSVLLDGEMIEFEQYHTNATHTWLNVIPPAQGEVSVVGTTVIPEFPAAIPLAITLFMGVIAIISLAAKGRLPIVRLGLIRR